MLHTYYRKAKQDLVEFEAKSRRSLGVTMRYKVSLKKTDEGYAVWVPGLPGCWSQGKTKAEALENIKDAIHLYLETVEEVTKEKESMYVEITNA